jgi:hypothetical protein
VDLKGEAAMAKAKKRVARKSSKRRKARPASARKKVAKRAAPKKAKFKARKPARSVRKATIKKKRSPKVTAKRSLRKLPSQTIQVEDTIVDVIDEPSPGMTRITEYETVRAITPETDAEPEEE